MARPLSELRRFAVQEPVEAAHAIARLEAENERLDDAIREILDVSTGWAVLNWTPQRKLRLITQIGNRAVAREND